MLLPLLLSAHRALSSDLNLCMETKASTLAARIRLLQLSRALGHHSAAFTLTRYTHLLPGDEVPALDLRDELTRSSGQQMGNHPHGFQPIPTESEIPET